MIEGRRFGLSAKTRGRMYYALSVAVFALFVLGPVDRDWIFGGIVVLVLWVGFVDPVGTDGKIRYLGFTRDQAKKSGIKSILGHRIDD